MKLSDLWTGEPDEFGKVWFGVLAVIGITTLYFLFLCAMFYTLLRDL